MQQTVGKIRPDNADMIRKLKAALEGAPGDAAMQIGLGLFVLGRLA